MCGTVVKALKADSRVPSTRLAYGAWCISVEMACCHSWFSLECDDFIILCNRNGG